MDRKKNKITIRSSAAEYLTYVAAVGDNPESIEVRYEDENIWLTQKMLATVYGVDVRTINYHIKKIYEDMGYQIYLMDKTINNEEFSNNVTQFDLLVSESDSSEDILTIEEVVLANYEEIFGTGM